MTSQIITQRILTADEGMYLTNGDTFGKTIILPFAEGIESWYEITEAEYNTIIAEQSSGQII